MANWRPKLTKPLTVRDGPTLRTLVEARDYVLELPANIQERSVWQAAARKMLEAANGGDINAASLQLELALFTTGRLRL